MKTDAAEIFCQRNHAAACGPPIWVVKPKELSR